MNKFDKLRWKFNDRLQEGHHCDGRQPIPNALAASMVAEPEVVGRFYCSRLLPSHAFEQGACLKQFTAT